MSDVRWVVSSFMLATALLKDLPALYTNFNELTSPESNRSGKEKSKYSGLNCGRSVYVERCAAQLEITFTGYASG